VRRLAWNLGRLARGLGRGGYQYSAEFLERLWLPARGQVQDATVINCFQLYPPSVVADASVEKWFFLDLTLRQLFDYYRVGEMVGARATEMALEREGEGYRAATGVVTMSRFAAESVRRDYGIRADRVHVVVPGANLDPVAYGRWAEHAPADPPASSGPLRLLMVATDWRRKGLDRLLRAMAQARLGGLEAHLTVVGAVAADLPPPLGASPNVTWLGRIAKDRDGPRFLDAVASAEVGCILSRYEAGGSVLREYHALGLAALATTAGGMPDFMFEDATVKVRPEASDEEIAQALRSIDRPRLARLRAAAWRRRREATWPAVVDRLRAVMDHPRAARNSS
jgi:glycosyltransferase involved in cell wall biosynthesis